VRREYSVATQKWQTAMGALGSLRIQIAVAGC